MQKKILSLMNKIKMKKSLTQEIIKKTINSKSANEVEELQEVPRYLIDFRIIESKQENFS